MTHLKELKHRVQDEEISSRVMGTMIARRVRALLARIHPPIRGGSLRQLDLLVHFLMASSYRAAQVASAHAVLDGDVAGVALAIDLRRAIFHLDVAELAERHALAGWR